MKNDVDIRKLGERLKTLKFEAPPYLDARITSRVEELRAHRQASFKWKILSGVLAMSLVAVIAVPIVREHASTFAVAARTDVMIQVSHASSANRARIAYVEVQLPDGVVFVAEGLPELEGVSKAKFAWAGDGLPVFVRAENAGIQALTLRFMDSDGALLEERQVKVRFYL